MQILALYPGGIPRRGPPSCEAPREPTIYSVTLLYIAENLKQSNSCLTDCFNQYHKLPSISGSPSHSKDTPHQRSNLYTIKYLTNYSTKPFMTCIFVFQDPGFSDSIRHVMDGSLPNSLKHVISNAEYYGPSLFLLATDVVTAYVFQEPSLLSSLQVQCHLPF